MPAVGSTTRAWLYVRDGQSIRIEIREGSISVAGPGQLRRQQECGDNCAAMLEHSSLERELVRNGWSLEQMTTERRSGGERRTGTRGNDRRRGLRLVGNK